MEAALRHEQPIFGEAIPIAGLPVAASPAPPAFGTRRLSPPLPSPTALDGSADAWAHRLRTHLRSVARKSITLRSLAAKGLNSYSRQFRCEQQAPPPALRSLADEWHATFARVLAYLGGLAVLAVLTAEFFRAPVVAAIEAVSRPGWVEAGKSHPAFSLPLSDLPELEPRYSIRRHAEGGGRKDIMNFGDPARPGRYLMVEIYRPGGEISRFADPAREIGALSGALSVTGGTRRVPDIETKFGPVALVEFMIRPATHPSHCLGFARAYDAPRMQIAGMFCTSEGIVRPVAVECALDRLTLLSSGNDQRVAELFARADLNRNFCAQRDHLLAATPKRPESRQGAEPLKLRGRL